LPDSKIKNLPASIRQKLLSLAQERNDDFGLVLTKYGLERMLFRLSKSKYRDTFILKGALLFELWTKERYRATRDADFLAAGANSPERFIRIFQEISAIEVQDDGLRFDPKTVKAVRIKEDEDYEGLRVTLTAFLEKAQISIQIDIGFGDAISPGPIETEYPTLLNLPGPRLLTYPRETVVSEKLEAMVKLGIANSRMKDFHDLHSLSKTFEFDGQALVDAVRATFERRGTAWPNGGTPLAFTSEFYEDENKIKQWKAFCNKNKPGVQEIEFKILIARLSSFLLPVLGSAEGGLELKSKWTPANGWKLSASE
jgi:Nucleotidyl transferase AbiEii toxin, Type IV TA system